MMMKNIQYFAFVKYFTLSVHTNIYLVVRIFSLGLLKLSCDTTLGVALLALSANEA